MEKYYFFDSNAAIGDRRLYSAADWSKVLSKFLENGIYVEGDNLTVTAAGDSMAVTIGSGVAFIDGHMYENDAPLTLNVDAAEATLDRIDLVVLRLDLTEQNRYIKAFMVKGEASATPVAPVPVSSTFIKEIPLAEIRVTAGKSIIEQNQVTDKRPDDFVDPFVDGSRITAIENNYAKKLLGNWFNPVFQNGWSNYQVGDEVRYRKDEFGIVHFEGLAKGGTSTVPILTLPEGYRPKKRLFTPVATFNGTIDVYGRILINTDGTVILSNGATNWVSLGSIKPFTTT